jgi:hypothetical protein
MMRHTLVGHVALSKTVYKEQRPIDVLKRTQFEIAYILGQIGRKISLYLKSVGKAQHIFNFSIGWW